MFHNKYYYIRSFCPLSVPNSPAVRPGHYGVAGGVQRVYNARLPQPGRHTDGQQHQERGITL